MSSRKTYQIPKSEVSMIVKVKPYGNVDVSRKECPTYACFVPTKWTHEGRTIDGKPNNWQDKTYSCHHRNCHGCPTTPKER